MPRCRRSTRRRVSSTRERCYDGRVRAIVAVIGALALGGVPPAAARSPEQHEIGVAPLQTEGEIPEFWRDEIATHVQTAIGEHARMCSVDACAEENATHVVRATLREAARVYTLEIELVDVASGERL